MVRTLIIFSIALELLPGRGMADSREKIGGGAINEKIRTYNPNKPSDQSTTLFSGGWDPTQNISQFLHAIVGLDRYPNYLSRFQNVQDVVALENALKQTLEKVEQQKNGMVKRRNDIADLVHHCAFSLISGVLDDLGMDLVNRFEPVVVIRIAPWNRPRHDLDALVTH